MQRANYLNMACVQACRRCAGQESRAQPVLACTSHLQILPQHVQELEVQEAIFQEEQEASSCRYISGGVQGAISGRGVGRILKIKGGLGASTDNYPVRACAARGYVIGRGVCCI